MECYGSKPCLITAVNSSCNCVVLTIFTDAGTSEDRYVTHISSLLRSLSSQWFPSKSEISLQLCLALGTRTDCWRAMVCYYRAELLHAAYSSWEPFIDKALEKHWFREPNASCKLFEFITRKQLLNRALLIMWSFKAAIQCFFKLLCSDKRCWYAAHG